MAVNRGGVAFWIACARSQGRRQPLTNQQRVVHRVFAVLPGHRVQRPLSSASWALAPPNSLRYQSAKRPALSHPFHHASQPQRAACCHDEEWVESFSVCLVVRRSEAEGLTTLVEIPMTEQSKHGEASTTYGKSNSLSFPLTMVDGTGLDDISVGTFNNSHVETTMREHGCFRSLFEAEKCPAPFVFGSHFYCFHCPPVEPLGRDEQACYGLDNLPVLLPSVWCIPAPQLEEAPPRGDSEEEQKLALMYERLRIELPDFFRKNHDYTMYSLDVEFINGLLNTKIRGRMLYQLSLAVWRLLCLCYYANVHLEVLKLTKHPEDGTIKARWRLRGLPVYSLLLRFYLRDKSHLYRSFDAFSTFYIGQDGLIHCHKVEKVMPARPPVLPRVTSFMAGALVALGLQEHRPALNLLPPLLSSLRNDRD